MPQSLYRPEPILSTTVERVDLRAPLAEAAARLRAGETLMVTDAYGRGADILDTLRRQLRPPAR